MPADDRKHMNVYINLFEQVTHILQHYHQEQIAPPTIAELAAITGNSEEEILESMEFGSSQAESRNSFLH